jgi:hypothetical protein
VDAILVAGSGVVPEMIDIEQWVFDNLDHPRKSSGSEVTAVCPSCGAAPGRFYVNVGGGPKSGAYICFKCELRGKRIWTLIAHVEGITPAQARAEAMRDNIRFTRRRKAPLASLAEQVAALRDREAVDTDDGRVAAELPRGFIPVHKPGRRSTWMRPVYLKQRGVRKATCRAFGLGYVQPGEWYPDEEAPGRQYIGERLVIPIVSPTGYSWSARDLTPDQSQQPKYLNPRGADHRRLLHGWDQVDVSSDIVLVEGPMDVIGMYQHGIPALALLGKELNREQLGLLCRKPSDASITVLLDPEEAEAPYKVARELTVRFEHIFIARLPDGVDPGDADRKQAWAAWDDAERYTGERTVGLKARLKSLGKSIN